MLVWSLERDMLLSFPNSDSSLVIITQCTNILDTLVCKDQMMEAHIQQFMISIRILIKGGTMSNGTSLRINQSIDTIVSMLQDTEHANSMKLNSSELNLLMINKILINALLNSSLMELSKQWPIQLHSQHKILHYLRALVQDMEQLLVEMTLPSRVQDSVKI